MPISARAYEGLRVAVVYNPQKAREFLDIMRTFPFMVKRKSEDAYGPLILLLKTQPGRPLVWSPPDALTERQWAACRVFGDEWLRGGVTKRALADAIEAILEQVGT